MPLWFYPGALATPDRAHMFEDIDAHWLEALQDPEVLEPREKINSMAVCGAEFVPGTDNKNQNEENMLQVWALVLDVDVWGERDPFTLDEIKEKLAGFRYVAFNTFSSSAACLYWRIIIPLAKPMPPGLYRSLWEMLNELLENTMASGTADPARLGFIGSVNSESGREAYRYHIEKGQRLDWSDFPLEDRGFSALARALSPADLKLSEDCTSPEQALKDARRYFRLVGEEVAEGSRHAALLTASCKLWWDFALEEEAVRQVLRMINNNFPDPKDEEEVEKELQAGFDRTQGKNRVEQPVLYGHEREPAVRITKQSVEEFARTLRRRKSDKARNAGQLLAKVLKREIFSEANDVRNATFRLVQCLAEEYWQEPPERILDLLLPSLTLQRTDPTSPVQTDKVILNRLRWVQDVKRKRVTERLKEQEDVRRLNIATAFDGERDTGYTAAEYRRFVAEGLQKNQWILQRGKAYYFFVDGSYRGPFELSEAKNFASVLLSPAYDRVAVSYTDPNGQLKSKTLDMLLQEHGTFVTSVEHDLNEQKTKLDQSSLVVGVDPQRYELVPSFSQRVDDWLKIFAGEKYEALLDWIAGLLYLDRPLATLYLCGTRGMGKNLLAHGLARLWSKKGPRTLRSFEPGDLEECPFVWANEVLPKRWRREDAFDQLKQFLDECSWPVKRVYADRYYLAGHARLLLTGNRPDLFSSVRDVLSGDETQSVKERVLFINNRGEEATEYLKKMGLTCRAFVEQDELAQHALWLRDNRPLRQEHRYLVQDPDDVFLDTLAVTSKEADRVLDWVLAYCSQRRFNTSAIASNGEDLYLVSSLVFGIWKNFDLSNRGIMKRTLEAALGTLAEKVKVLTPKNNVVTAWKISGKRLFLWGQIHETDVGEIVDALPLLKQKQHFREEEA